MPELPEVEVTRQSFAAHIAGGRILALHLGKPLRWPLGVPPESLVGQTVHGVRRRGKYLLIDLDDGLLMLHLGMSGSVRFGPHLGDLVLHDHVQLLTTQGELRLNDPRRFGALVYSKSETLDPARKLLASLGVEPLTADFTPAMLYLGLQKRRISVKQALLAGDIVVGVGNIYASEALFRAGIAPHTPAHRISKARAARLHAAIVQVLQIALTHGGSTLRNFSNAQGKTGYFQLEVMVYGRTGQPCHVCSTPIKQLVQGQRSTFYCPQCQR